MKPAVLAGRTIPAQKHAKPASSNTSLREHVVLSDLTDGLLSAYDGVSRLAYEKFRLRGSDSAGHELEDWLDAESELLGQMEVHIADSGDFVNALASVPGYRSTQISLGVEPRWLLIFARSGTDDHVEKHLSRESLDALRGPPAVDVESLAKMCSQATGDQFLTHREKSDRTAAHLFYICELPSEVDPLSCTAIVCNGVLGIRLAKVRVIARNAGFGIPTS